MHTRWWIWRIFAGIGIFALVTVLLSAVVMLLWNALIPQLFGGPALSFAQAAGLLILSHILLRGWSPWRHSQAWRRDRWSRRFEERLAGMTPEEQQKFREEWRQRCGWDPGKHFAGGSTTSQA
jgi:hypothetical protein